MADRYRPTGALCGDRTGVCLCAEPLIHTESDYEWPHRCSCGQGWHIERTEDA